MFGIANAELQVGQIDIAVDEVVAQTVFIEEIPFAVEDNQRLAGPLSDRHRREFRFATFLVALLAVPRLVGTL